jgi:hypothetical protein
MRRALVSIFLIACSGRIELPHWGDDPPPRSCNGHFTWGDAPLLAPGSVTVYLPAQNPGALTYRLTESSNACAEVNAGATAGDFLEIAIDGAGSRCTSCLTSRCDDLYRSEVHTVLVHGTDRTELGQSIVHVTCDGSFSDGGVSRASIDLVPADGGPLHFLIVSPLCLADNDCSGR